MKTIRILLQNAPTKNVSGTTILPITLPATPAKQREMITNLSNKQIAENCTLKYVGNSRMALDCIINNDNNIQNVLAAIEVIKQTGILVPVNEPIVLELSDKSFLNKTKEKAFFVIYKNFWPKIIKQFKLRRFEIKNLNADTELDEQKNSFQLFYNPFGDANILKNCLAAFSVLEGILQKANIIVENNKKEKLENFLTKEIKNVSEEEEDDILRNGFVAAYLKESFIDPYLKTGDLSIRQVTNLLMKKYKTPTIQYIEIDFCNGKRVVQEGHRGGTYIEVATDFLKDKNPDEMLLKWTKETIKNTDLQTICQFDPFAIKYKTRLLFQEAEAQTKARMEFFFDEKVTIENIEGFNEMVAEIKYEE